jgi:hypothetical protein
MKSIGSLCVSSALRRWLSALAYQSDLGEAQRLVAWDMGF